MKISIIVRFQFEGVHSWPGAPTTKTVGSRSSHDQFEVTHPQAYLAVPHRHVFHVEAKRRVTHTERDVEFIAFKNQMETWCRVYLEGPHTKSCETMAQELLEKFELSSCRVFEDLENGAEVSVD